MCNFLMVVAIKKSHSRSIRWPLHIYAWKHLCEMRWVRWNHDLLQVPGRRWFLVLGSLLLHGGRWDQILVPKPTYWRGGNSNLDFFFFFYFEFWMSLEHPRSQVWFVVQMLQVFMQCLLYLTALFKIIQNGWHCFAGLEWALRLLVRIQELLDVVIWTYLVFDCFSWKVSRRWHFWTKVIVKIKCAVLFRCWCR